MVKKFFTIGIIVVALGVSTFSAFAQENRNLEGVVIDERCIRERTVNPGGPYAKFCKIDDNLETDILCLNRAFPEEKGFFDNFDLFNARIRITPETLPSLIRAAILTAFAIVGVMALWMIIWGYNKWSLALNSSPEEAEKLWKLYTNGMFGLLFALTSLLITWGIFYAAGVRRNEFFEVGNEISSLLSFPCEDLSDYSDACRQYNYSCNYNPSSVGTSGRAEDECIETLSSERNQIVRNMPTAVPTPYEYELEGSMLTYQGPNPCE